jgi:uncharacterized membrane protein
VGCGDASSVECRQVFHHGGSMRYCRRVRRRLGLIALLVVTLSWNAALVAAPASDAPRLSALVYVAGSLICHQRSDRSFHRDGAQYPVCARCFGLYAGALVGVVAWLALAGVGTAINARGRRVIASGVRQMLVVAALPTALTVLTAAVGWWDPDNLLRAAVAVPLGAAIAAVTTAVAVGDLR